MKVCAGVEQQDEEEEETAEAQEDEEEEAAKVKQTHKYVKLRVSK